MFDSSLKINIVKATEKHRKDINRLIRETKIGNGIKGSLKNFWVAKIDGKVVGCAGLEFHNDVAIFTSAVVEKQYRRQGIGTCLVNIRLAKAFSREEIRYAAFCTMYYRFKFYTERGFKSCPRKDLPSSMKDYWMFTDPQFNKCIVMYRDLRSK